MDTHVAEVEQHREDAAEQRHHAIAAFEEAATAHRLGRPQRDIQAYARAARLHRRAAKLHDQLATYLATHR